MPRRWWPNGNLSEALKVIERTHRPDHPDWKLLSAQGTIYDQLGRHAEAGNIIRRLW
jgi:Flp pilus assembly protein TadD